MTISSGLYRHLQKAARLVASFALIVSAVLVPAHAGETITYFHNDVAGSPILATDVNGMQVWKETYRPYGDRLYQASASSNNKLWFTGKSNDPSTGLSYMGARYYDPALGRFMGVDPAPLDLENLHSLNRYAYANNNPYKFVDPDGREAVGAAWLQRTDAFFSAMPGPRNNVEAGLELAVVALPFAAASGVLAIEAALAGLANPAAALAITESVLAAEALGGGSLVVAGGVAAAASAAARGGAAFAREAGILRDAARGKGNFGLGSGTRAEAERLGRAWVGDGAKLASDGKTLVSADGLRQFRPPSFKPNLGIEQANFEQRLVPSGQWFGNGHLDIGP